MSITKKKLLDWKKVKADLDAAKAKELKLRIEICSEIAGEKLEGVCTSEKFGMTVKATPKLNKKIDVEVYKELLPNLTSEEKACVKYTPSLVAAQYKKLGEQSRLHSAIVAKPGTPTLAITDIKPKD